MSRRLIPTKLEKEKPSLSDYSNDLLFAPVEGLDLPVRNHISLIWNRLAAGRYPRLAVNIVGPNGAGKSVFPKALVNLDPDTYFIRSEDGKKRIATIFPNLRWAAVGPYKTKCGGCDSLDKNHIFEALYRLCDTDLHIVMEGSITSNTKLTYWRAFEAIRLKFPFRKTLFCILDYPFEECLRRVYERNGGKQVKEDMIESKWDNIQRYKDFYLDEGTTPVHIESSSGVRELFLSLVNAFDSTLGSECLPFN